VTLAATGALLGLLAAAGLLVAVAASPPLRRVRLEHRLAPYLRDSVAPSRLLGGVAAPTRLPGARGLGASLLHRAATAIDATLGGAQSVRRRLDQAGRGVTLEQFRNEQVLCGLAGLLAGLAVAGLASVRGSRANPVAFLLLAIVFAAGGVLSRDRWLSVEVARRERRMLVEFPVVAELLALSVTAGEGAAGALERVSRLARGELSRELGRALADTRSGTPLVVALERMAARTSLPVLTRFVDGMAVAVERGTPLAEVLRAQAADVREHGRRQLLEAGGRKEVAMLLPVVFLILPVTVVFTKFRL
jgi:tight adherence protein C